MGLLKKGMLILAVLVAAGFGGWWWTTGSSNAVSQPRTPERVSEARPAEPERAGTVAGQSPAVTSQVQADATAPTTGETQDRTTTSPGEDEVLQRFRERGCIDRSLTRVEQLTPTRRATLKAWLESEGHFGPIRMTQNINVAPFDDYSSYGIETLRQLARDQQDPKAQVALGTRLAAAGEHEAAKHWFRESAINGYSATIGQIGALEMVLRFQNRNDRSGERDPDEFRSQLREANLGLIAYLEFAAIRGAPGAGPALDMLTDPEEPSMLPTGLNDYTEQELAQARERGQELYETFEAERLERSLPPFDNSRPEIADLLDADTRSMMRAMGEGLRPCDMPTLPNASD